MNANARINDKYDTTAGLDPYQADWSRKGEDALSSHHSNLEAPRWHGCHHPPSPQPPVI